MIVYILFLIEYIVQNYKEKITKSVHQYYVYLLALNFFFFTFCNSIVDF